jgi:glutamine synthetase
MSELETKHYIANGSKEAPAAKEAIEWAGQTRAQLVDLKFCDLLGRWQHMTLPLAAFDESAFDEGLGFDGSSIRGWQGISESDMLLMPDPASAILDPFTEAPTLSLICEIADPVTGERYGRDPRGVAARAEAYLTETRIADTSYFGPECEFFVFDEVSYDLGPNHSHYAFDSAEGHWNSGKPGLGNTIREKEGYFPPAPHDTLHDLRSAMVLTLERLGIPCEFHHHEVASGGQCEIDLRYQTLTRMADQVMTYKYVVKNVARAAGKTVTFMPKPLFGDNGSGMHTHQSLWKEGTPLMADKSGYAGLSQLARAYLAGLLMHAPALLALCAPTTNSYRRLVPGYEAPVNLVYSQRNRSACIRIPMYSDSPKAKRIEFRCPDAAANPYLAFAAMLMAGIDGIQKGLDPGEPADYDLFEENHGPIAQVPGSLSEALDALEVDHEFLTQGGVFSEELIRTWIDWKRENEVDVVALRPHPAEFALYYDAEVELRELRQEDWPAVREIYEQGIAGKNATFETEAPSWEAWDRSQLDVHRYVAVEQERVVGWVAAHPVSSRPCYAGVVEHSVYVHDDWQGKGIGRALLERLFQSTEEAGIWTIQTGIFPENEASLALHEKCGFRIVGTQERLGKLDGVWRDVVVLERRSEVIS